MQLVTVATFESEPPAQVLKDRLAGAGVPAHMYDERNLQRFWFLAKPHAAVHVRVETDQWDSATRLSETWDEADGVLQAAIRCPECGSPRIEYPQTTRHFISPTLLIHMLRAVGVLKKQAYCKKCQHTWSLSNEDKKKGSTSL